MMPAAHGADTLAELALNLRWSWNHAADELWRALDAELWSSTRNPWVILQTVSRDTMEAVLARPEFRQKLDDLQRENRDAYHADSWFRKAHPESPLTLAAYSATIPITAYVESVAVGDPLPAMPVFLEPGRYVPAPLEETYQRTWEKCPTELKEQVRAGGDQSTETGPAP